MTQTTPMRTLISAATLALVLTACGGGDNGDSTQADPSPSGSTSTSAAASSSASPTQAETAEQGGLVSTDYGYTCESMFVEGAPMPAEAEEGCYDEADDSLAASFPEDCADGGKLILNPKGFGIVGKETYLPAPGDDEPDVNSPEYKAVAEECNPS